MVNASAHLLATKEDDADSESREEDASIDSCVRDVGQKWWNRQSARRKAKPTAAAIDPFWVKYTSGFAKGIQVADHPSRSSLDPTMWNKNYVKNFIADMPNAGRCLSEVDIEIGNIFKVNSKGQLQRVNANDDNDVMNVESVPDEWIGKVQKKFEDGKQYVIWRFEPCKMAMVGTVKAGNRHHRPTMASYFVFVPSTAVSMGPDEFRKSEICVYNADPVTPHDITAQNVFIAGPKTDQMIRRLTGGLVSCSGLKFKEEDLGRTFVVTSGAKGDAASAFTLAQCDRYGVPLEGHLTEKMAEKTSSSVKATNTKAKNPAPVNETKIFKGFAEIFEEQNITGTGLHGLTAVDLKEMGIANLGVQLELIRIIQKLFSFTLEDEIQCAIDWLTETEGMRSTRDLMTAKPDFWSKAFLNMSTPIVTELQEKYAWSAENWLKFYKSELRQEHVNVDVAVHISDVNQIVPDQGTFHCALSLRLNWIEPTMKKTFLEKGTILTKGVDVMDLQVGFENGVGEELVSQTVKLLDPVKGLVQEESRYRATFSSLMTMLSFPFDKQTLSVEISSQYGNLISFSNSPWDHTDANIQVEKNHEQVLHGLEWEVKVPDWKERYFWTGVKAPWVTMPPGATKAGVVNLTKSLHAMDHSEDPFYEEEKKADVVRVQIQATRKPIFFIWGYFLLMCLITLMVFSVCAYDPSTQYDERLNTVLSLQLTGVAFKLASDSTLPPVSSVTFVDAYMLLSIYFLSMFGFNVFVFSLFFEDGTFAHWFLNVASDFAMVAFWVWLNACTLYRMHELKNLDYNFEDHFDSPSEPPSIFELIFGRNATFGMFFGTFKSDKEQHDKSKRAADRAISCQGFGWISRRQGRIAEAPPKNSVLVLQGASTYLAMSVGFSNQLLTKEATCDKIKEFLYNGVHKDGKMKAQDFHNCLYALAILSKGCVGTPAELILAQRTFLSEQSDERKLQELLTQLWAGWASSNRRAKVQEDFIVVDVGSGEIKYFWCMRTIPDPAKPEEEHLLSEELCKGPATSMTNMLEACCLALEAKPEEALRMAQSCEEWEKFEESEDKATTVHQKAELYAKLAATLMAPSQMGKRKLTDIVEKTGKTYGDLNMTFICTQYMRKLEFKYEVSFKNATAMLDTHFKKSRSLDDHAGRITFTILTQAEEVRYENAAAEVAFKSAVDEATMKELDPDDFKKACKNAFPSAESGTAPADVKREELKMVGNIAWGRGSTQGLVNGRKVMMPFSFDKVAQACALQVDPSNEDAKFRKGSTRPDGSERTQDGAVRYEKQDVTEKGKTKKVEMVVFVEPESIFDFGDEQNFWDSPYHTSTIFTDIHVQKSEHSVSVEKTKFGWGMTFHSVAEDRLGEDGEEEPASTRTHKELATGRTPKKLARASLAISAISAMTTSTSVDEPFDSEMMKEKDMWIAEPTVKGGRLTIKSVDARVNGTVLLSDGSSFRNPAREGFAEEGVLDFASNVVQYLLGIKPDPWLQSRFSSALGRQPSTYNDLYDLCVLNIPGAPEELMKDYSNRFNDRYLAHNVIADIGERIRNNVHQH